ncbi:MAG: efflux RND transporter periplasmic adaptor subunit [Ignavibacteriales bacterium]|nr:efflux RND transporter periplasmic adaptor subunit [Ignavibacteriales bacterium]
MVTGAPKLRGDVTASRQQNAGDVTYVLKDPLSGKFFRCGEAEKFIAEQCDGKTSVDAILRRTKEKFNAPLSAELLQSFLNNLEKNNLLETDETLKKVGKKKKRINGNLLYLRFEAFDPDSFFTRIGPIVKPFFTKQFIVFSSTTILLAVLILLNDWGQFSQDLSRLYQFSSIPLFMFLTFIVISLHECAHGLTCKYFGGEVHEMGFMLIYFQPAFYCNVSDAWLFPEKAKRLWVSFAGPYFELFLWSLAVLMWSVTAADTWVNHFALIVMTGSGIKTLLNFNPFIKYDGYYLLSDYLRIPNLRKKSFRFVGAHIKKFIGLEYVLDESATARHRMIYFVYGSIASIGSFSLLAYVTVSLGDFLIQNQQPLALALATTLLGVRFRKKFRRLFGGSNALDDEEDFGDSDQQTERKTSSTERHSKEKSHSRPRTFVVNEEGIVIEDSQRRSEKKEKEEKEGKKTDSNKRKKILWVAVAVIVILLFFVPVELGISGPFTILPIHNADVRSQIDGIVEEIYVTEGDLVKEGDIIARFSVRENMNELLKTEEQIRQASAKLRMMEAGPTKEQVALAQTEVDRAEEHLKYSRLRLQRDKVMLDKDLISQREYENTQELAVTAETDLASAQWKLTVLVKGARREEKEAARAEIGALRTQHRYLQEQITRAELRSPVAGIVATPARQLSGMRHQSVQKGMLVAKVFDFKKLTVEIAVPEKEIADVKIGYDVALKAQAYPHETFFGKVTTIATSATSSGSSSPTPQSTYAVPSAGTSKTILVTTEIDNSAQLLKPEMTGQAKIYCGKRSVAEIVTRKIIRTIKVDFWSWL